MVLRSSILRPSALCFLHPVSRRSIAVHPRTGGNPLIERQAGRALPDIKSPQRFNLLTIPVFLLIMGGSALAIFNYQKSSSSVVASTLYSLRVHPQAREVLGDEIQLKHHFPVIWGEINQLHGHIDISYAVKGTKGDGMMRFKSTRKSKMGLFTTDEWHLTTKDGQKLVLLEGAHSLPKSE